MITDRKQKERVMYMCSPDKNTACKKTGCLFYLLGKCFSTLDEQYAVRDKDGEPVSFPEDQYEDTEQFIVKKWKETVYKAIVNEFLFGNVDGGGEGS